MKYRDKLTDDILHRHPDLTAEDAYNIGLYEIDKIIQETKKSLADFPSMPKYTIRENLPTKYIDQGYDPAIYEELAKKKYALMYDEQQAIYNRVRTFIRQKANEKIPTHKCIFIERQAGAG